MAGATGALGNEVFRRLAGAHAWRATQILAREPIRQGMRAVSALVVGIEAIDSWPIAEAGTGVIMFDPPRLYYNRERALWTPQPEQLVALAQWMRRSGVHTLVVVLPHAQGRLPEALKRGLASLDEHAVATLGFERVLLVRTPAKASKHGGVGYLERTAAWMLSIFSFMVPASEQPPRASKVAEFVAEAVRLLPPGIHVASPDLVWNGTHGDVRGVVSSWLLGDPGQSTAKSAQ
ncbi:hypothetical protein BH11PSE7_BH11PSE7_35620 [soil metagenome]